MKKDLSVHEFADYIGRSKPSSVSLMITEDQPWNNPSDPFKCDLTFSTMVLYENPNVIYLRHENGGMVYIDHVRHVKVDEDTCLLGTVFKVFCGDFRSEKDEYTYLLIST